MFSSKPTEDLSLLESLLVPPKESTVIATGIYMIINETQNLLSVEIPGFIMFSTI